MTIPAAQRELNSYDRSQAEAEPDRIFQMAYVSTQTRPLSQADLVRLLETARGRNLEAGITGMLLHRSDSFFQVLEGDRDRVMAVYEQIKRDRRHERLEILYEDQVPEREFSEWQMGFVDLDEIDVSSVPGYSDFLVNKDEPRELFTDLSRSRRLMLLFRSIM